MKSRLITGFLASVTSLLLPFILLGMGQKNTAAQEPAVPAPSPPAAVEEKEERTVQEIIVHRQSEPSFDASITVNVEIQNQPTTMDLHAYLVGVLMGEMPASFELEALKAQTVAARTYTLRRLEAGGILSDDPAVCQAYTDPATALEKWGENWGTYLEKLEQAVTETDGQVLTFNGKLITATYFSCSGGKTESAQAVWGGEVPYLVSVESPGEESASAYESLVEIPMEQFLTALEVSSPNLSAVTYTQGGGVDTITIGGKTFGGTALRSLLNLRSTLFTMEITSDSVIFHVQGYGHRVGLSQYGAQAMAEAGSTHEEILKWYYTGVEIETLHR